MARTIEQIIELIIDKKNSYPSLSALNNPSNTARWLNLIETVAFAQNFQEQLFDELKNEIDTLISNAIVGTDAWWLTILRGFQVDSTPVLDTTTFKIRYEPIDENLQIIKFVAVQNIGYTTYLKVGKLDNLGNITNLSTEEFTQAKAFVDLVQFAGTQVRLVSLPPDNLKLRLKVYHDGVKSQAILTPEVEDAVTAYFKDVKFRGVVFLSNIKDLIQLIPNVTDVEFGVCEAKIAAVSDFDIFTRKYETLAGYATVDLLEITFEIE
jgi:hypothetical protein